VSEVTNWNAPLAEEFHRFLVAARLLENFAVFRYDSVA
jgi:hypothetical protein